MYKELLSIAQLMGETMRLVGYARYYKSLNIDGLHYIHQVEGTQVIAIVKPNHSTHHEATTFLMNLLLTEKLKMNTVTGHAQNLKKFLDYMMFWRLEEDFEHIHNIEVKAGGPYPIEVILLGFADYLRCIPKGYKPFEDLKVATHGIHWSMLKNIPLNKHAMAEGKLSTVIRSSHNDLKKTNWCEYPSGALAPIIYTACAYLKFLRDRTTRFKYLPLEQVPRKEIRDNHSLIAGTAGSRVRIVFDVENIARDSGTTGPGGGKSRQASPINHDKVFSETEADMFFELIDPYENALDLLLFAIWRYFGLRPGEAAEIRIEPSTIPSNLNVYHTAREELTESLSGNLQFVKERGLRGNWVIDTGWKTKASCRDVALITHKTIDPFSRKNIRFPTQEEFTDLLYWALLQRRELLSYYTSEDHGYLFVSESNNSKGKPLSKKGVYSKYNNLADDLFQRTGGSVDLRSYYPHTFRHLFATSLLLRYRRPIEEISKWLGHSSVVITRDTYIYWIPESNNDTEKGKVDHLGRVFMRQAEISEGIHAHEEDSE